jgi:DNA repair protein RadC
MKLKGIPWYDRPGFRLTREGVERLSNPELLSIILLAGGREDNVLELSN